MLQAEAVQRELDRLGATLRQIEAYNESMKGEIAVTRRAAYAAEEAMQKLEKEKQQQDYLIDDLQVRGPMGGRHWCEGCQPSQAVPQSEATQLRWHPGHTCLARGKPYRPSSGVLSSCGRSKVPVTTGATGKRVQPAHLCGLQGRLPSCC